MTKGVSHKQEFFESQVFSCQNWPKREFYTEGQLCACPHLPTRFKDFPEDFRYKPFREANKKGYFLFILEKFQF